VKPWWE